MRTGGQDDRVICLAVELMLMQHHVEGEEWIEQVQCGAGTLLHHLVALELNLASFAGSCLFEA